MQNREKSKVLKDSCIYSTITHLFILWESSYMFLQLENSEVSLQAHFFRLVNITQGNGTINGYPRYNASEVPVRRQK